MTAASPGMQRAAALLRRQMRGDDEAARELRELARIAPLAGVAWNLLQEWVGAFRRKPGRVDALPMALSTSSTAHPLWSE